ncbi:MAG: hypothetical protein KAX18_10805 [Candidatus Lokiarchaeota archaeon]|nr:hypothetical protein [Candidatus Lokiarchaeota archaeon]
MSVISEVSKNQTFQKKFIDWDPNRNVFYDNIYLEDQKIVIKMPLIHTNDSEDYIKIKKFNLEKYTFLINY